MHLALFANNLHPYRVGGMQKHTTMLARHLPAAGTRVDVYYRRDGSQPEDSVVHQELFDGDPAIRVRSIVQRPLPRVPGHYYANCWWESRALWRAMRQTGVRYDFVYTQGYTGWHGVSASARAEADRPPVGVHAHGIEALQESWGPWRTLRHSFAPVWQRSIIRRADYNLSLGGRLDDLIASAGGKRETILPAYNGVDQQWLRPVDQIVGTNKARFLFVGRDSTRKGFDELNAAIAQLVGNPAFEIDIVGPIDPQNRTDSPNVTYHGLVKQEDRLREIYRACDVLVCPSYSEGMPTVILEAMASGLAVIATDVGAVGLLVGGENGWLIPPRDAQALAVSMRAAMNEDLAEKKRSGRTKVECYTWDAVTRKFIDELRRAVNGTIPSVGATEAG